MSEFFQSKHSVGGVVFFNSRGGMLADYFARNGIKDIHLIGVDLTVSNVKGLREGYIDFLIGQEPEHRGFCHEDNDRVHDIQEAGEATKLRTSGYIDPGND